MTNMTGLKLAASGDSEMVMTQVLKAPPRLVFGALTRPDLMHRWFSPPGWTLAVCEVDLVVGGKYRHVWKQDSDGTEMGMGGEYRAIVAPSHLVRTEAFDVPWYPGIAVLTTTLAERGGHTDFRAVLRYETKDARDMVLGSNMEQGVSAVYDRLAMLLADLQPATV